MATTNRRPPAPPQETRDAYVGKTFFLPMEDMLVLVDVRDVRNRFGHLDALVAPLSGRGDKWVQADRLTTASSLVASY